MGLVMKLGNCVIKAITKLSTFSLCLSVMCSLNYFELIIHGVPALKDFDTHNV